MNYYRRYRLNHIVLMILILTITGCSGLSEEEKQNRTATAVQLANIQATNNAYATQTATLWTDTPTPTSTNTLTATNTATDTSTPTSTFTATNTLTPSDTPTPTNTVTPTNTATDTPTATPTLTLTKTPLPTPTATYTPVAYTINGNRAVNARSCTEGCSVVDTINGGETIFVVSKLEGDRVNGSNEWLELNVNGTQVFVHSSLASIAPTVTPTRDPNNIQIKTYYVNSNSAVNARSCASTDCAVAGAFNRGDKLDVIDDSGDWYEIELANGSSAFIAEFLTSKTKPAALPTAAPIRATAIQQQQVQPTVVPQQQVQPTVVPQQQVQPTQEPISVVPMQSTVPPAPAYTCDCNKTCGSMTCDEAYFQLNTCGCGRRDGDGDGVPCESVCPGG